MIHLYCLAVQAGFYSDGRVLACHADGPGSIPGRGKMLFPFFHLLHLAPNVNNPHVCIKKNSLSLISRDSRTPRNSGTNFNLEGENVTGYRYMIHLYCLAVQAGFYSDAVEC